MVRHPRQHAADLICCKIQTTTVVDIVNFCASLSWLQIWNLSGFGIVDGDDLDRFDTELGQQKILREFLSSMTYVNGSSAYWENMVTSMLFTISTLVLSRAVISMNTFLVSGEIFE